MTQPPLIIAGGGLAGALTALVLATRRPELPILLVEQEESFGGNHIWSFFDSDVEPEAQWLVDALIACRWPDHEVSFPARRRKIAIGYNSVTSRNLDAAVRARLRPDQYRLGTAVRALTPDHVVLESGERIEAQAVLDARGGALPDGLDLAWQKFVGRTYRFPAGHPLRRPAIMDALVDQQSGYRFVYTLPFSGDELLVEDTYYSTSPTLDVPLLRARIDSYVQAGGWGHSAVVAEETGVLPLLLGGTFDRLWPASEEIGRLGLRGGFFHPTTGYSFPDAVRTAFILVQQKELSSAALHAFLRGRSEALWKQRGFYRLLNRMLFRAAPPHRRYRVLEHFYRLPEGLIGRFYGARLTALDKLRILSGRPPVPLGTAFAAMRGRA